MRPRRDRRRRADATRTSGTRKRESTTPFVCGCPRSRSRFRNGIPVAPFRQGPPSRPIPSSALILVRHASSFLDRPLPFLRTDLGQHCRVERRLEVEQHLLQPRDVGRRRPLDLDARAAAAAVPAAPAAAALARLGPAARVAGRERDRAGARQLVERARDVGRAAWSNDNILLRNNSESGNGRETRFGLLGGCFATSGSTCGPSIDRSDRGDAE